MEPSDWQFGYYGLVLALFDITAYVVGVTGIDSMVVLSYCVVSHSSECF